MQALPACRSHMQQMLPPLHLLLCWCDDHGLWILTLAPVALLVHKLKQQAAFAEAFWTDTTACLRLCALLAWPVLNQSDLV